MLVESLGIFGIFGNEMDRVPDAVLRADHRISWVVNNAYKWKAAKLYEHGGGSARGAELIIARRGMPSAGGASWQHPSRTLGSVSAECQSVCGIWRN